MMMNDTADAWETDPSDEWDPAVTPDGSCYVSVLYYEQDPGTIQVPLRDIANYDLMAVNPVSNL